MRNRIVLLCAILTCSVAWGQTDKPAAGESSSSSTGQSTTGQSSSGSSMQSMPGMNMSGHDMSKMGDAADDEKSDAAGANAMHSMEGHMDMGPHMKMTALRQAKPGDAERAQKIVEEARKASEKYADYHVALNEGFRIFLPNVPQKMYHFTNYRYGAEAKQHFNPEHPTSLLYEKQGDGYKLIGVMYTASRTMTEDQLDAFIPLSVAQWHEHVNFCIPPMGKWSDLKQEHPQFGLRGSIATQEACDAAGGRFRPVVLDWMVHIYPFEKDQAAIWSVERQHAD